MTQPELHMMHHGRFTTSVIASAASLLLAGCATRGALQKAMAEQRTAIGTERTERVAADSATQQDIASLRTDQQSLRTDLQSVKTEFGAKIAMVEQGMQFALPVNFDFDQSIVRDRDRAA